MEANITVFDIVLVTGLFWIIYEVLFSRSLFNAAVLYIIFGLVISIIWVRLEANDVALAEAAIGSGLTGAMFLEAVRQIKGHKRSTAKPGVSSLIIFPLLTLLAYFLTLSLLNASADLANISKMVENNLSVSGVKQPVTSLLLNFRGYDTLLEIMVLIITAIGTLALGKNETTENDTDDTAHKVLSKVVKILIPFIIIVSGYILYLGSSASGGAFQAGAILAAMLVLLKLSGFKVYFPRKIKNTLLIMGFSVFLIVSLAFIPFGNSFLQYPLNYNYQLIFLIEASLTISIGIILYTLFEIISINEKAIENVNK